MAGKALYMGLFYAFYDAWCGTDLSHAFAYLSTVIGIIFPQSDIPHPQNVKLRIKSKIGWAKKSQQGSMSLLEIDDELFA